MIFFYTFRLTVPYVDIKESVYITDKEYNHRLTQGSLEICRHDR